MSKTRIPLSGPFFSVSVFRGGFRGVAGALSHRRCFNRKTPFVEHCGFCTKQLESTFRAVALEGAITALKCITVQVTADRSLCFVRTMLFELSD